MMMDLSTKQVLECLVFSLIGTPYRWGGDDAIEGFDCSGLVVELGQSVGLFPPGFDINSEGLRRRFPTIDRKEARFGDLAIYGNAASASHVGFCLSSSLMVEAGGGDQRTVDLKAAAQQNAFVRVRPIDRRKDLLCIVRPAWPA